MFVCNLQLYSIRITQVLHLKCLSATYNCIQFELLGFCIWNVCLQLTIVFNSDYSGFASEMFVCNLQLYSIRITWVLHLKCLSATYNCIQFGLLGFCTSLIFHYSKGHNVLEHRTSDKVKKPSDPKYCHCPKQIFFRTTQTLILWASILKFPTFSNTAC
jgi:hypothetical protein